MTVRAHKLRIPRRIVDEVFGSEVELIAAINRYAKNPEGTLWEGAEAIEVTIPHETWECFRDARGTMEVWKLRSVIMLAVAERSRARDGRQPGTLMIAQKKTVCPVCQKPVEPENPMINVSVSDGSTQAVHVFCANREQIPYQATARLGDGLKWLRERAIERWLGEIRQTMKG